MNDLPHPGLDPLPGQPDWDALARYHAGESSETERHTIERWLAEHPAEARLLSALDEATSEWTPAPLADDAIDVEAALARVNARRRQPAVVRLPVRRTAWMAAAAVLVVAVTVMSWQALRRQASLDAGLDVARSIETATGVRDSLRLADGSTVILAPASRLTIAFDGGARRVSLEGAALFRVRHDPARPFTVRAGDVTLRDIGTEFSVRTSPASSTIIVAVTEGSVAVRVGAASEIVLQGGDRARTDSTRVVVERGGAGVDDAAWAQGRLTYRAAPLTLVADDLWRWYGVRLQVDSSLAGRRLTADLTGLSADRALAMIALALGAEIERTTATTAVLRPARRR